MSYEHFVAGILGGFTSTLTLHPLDLVKIRLSVSDGQSSVKRNYSGVTHAFKTIVREEGFRGLYRGVTANCLGAGTAWGLYFLFYDSIKTHMIDGLHPERQGPVSHMTAGACAGLLTTAITNPIWVVKTRLCLQYGDATKSATSVPESRKYSGTWDAFRKVYKHERLRGLYKGFVPGLLGVTHGAVQLTAYEELKKLYPLDESHSLGPVQYISCAASSKILAVSLTYPFQLVRARLQDQHVHYKGILDVIRQTWRRESLLGFYKGFSASLLRVVPACAITFVVYESVLQAFL